MEKCLGKKKTSSNPRLPPTPTTLFDTSFDVTDVDLHYNAEQQPIATVEVAVSELFWTQNWREPTIVAVEALAAEVVLEESANELKQTVGAGFDAFFTVLTVVLRWTMQRVMNTLLLCDGALIVVCVVARDKRNVPVKRRDGFAMDDGCVLCPAHCLVCDKQTAACQLCADGYVVAVCSSVSLCQLCEDGFVLADNATCEECSS